MLAVTKSIVDDHRIAIEPDSPGSIQGKDGRYYAISGIGKSLANIPFYLAGKVISRLSSRFPESYYYLFSVSLLDPLLSALTCALLFLVCRRFGFTTRKSVWLTCIYGLGTIAFLYAKDDLSEPLATLLVLSGVYCAYIYTLRINWRWILLSAILLGLAVATRYILALLPVLVGAYLIVKYLSAQQEERVARLRDIALFCFILGAFASALSFYNYTRFGTILETGYDQAGGGLKGFTFMPSHLLPHLSGLLVSPGRGLFFYMPVLILALAGVKPFYARYKHEAMLFGISFLIFLVIQSAYIYWIGGSAWGPRFLLPQIPLLIPFIGFALCLDFFKRPLGKAFAWALISISILIQLSAVVVPWQRYVQVLAIKEDQGESVDFIWDIKNAQPIAQWKEVFDVFSITREEKKAMRYEVADKQLPPQEYLKVSLGMNVPDFWFVHFYYLGVPFYIIAIPLFILMTVLGSTLYLLRYKLVGQQ